MLRIALILSTVVVAISINGRAFSQSALGGTVASAPTGSLAKPVAPPAATQLQINEFNANPQSILNSPGSLTDKVAALALADKTVEHTTINNLVSLAKELNKQLQDEAGRLNSLPAGGRDAAASQARINLLTQQLKDIGSGLGVAAANITDPALSLYIQTAIGTSGVALAITAFNGIVGGVQTTSTGVGGGGGAGGGANPVNVNFPTGGASGNNNPATTGATFGSASGGLTGGGSVSGGSGTTTGSTVAQSVSPR